MLQAGKMLTIKPVWETEELEKIQGKKFVVIGWCSEVLS